MTSLPQQKGKEAERGLGERTKEYHVEELWNNADDFYEEPDKSDDYEEKDAPTSKGLIVGSPPGTSQDILISNTRSGHPRQPVKFLLDDSTSSFRDIVLREGYETKHVDVPGSSPPFVLQIAHIHGMALLTLDKSYLSIARENNKHGILILPESFIPVHQDGEQKAAWLRELLQCHDEVNRIRFFPIRAYMAKKEETGWKVEEARGEVVNT